MTEGIKHDEGKARFDLIPAVPLLKLAEVYTFGAKKYQDHNWRKGLSFGRLFGATMRHMWAFWHGHDLDPESGLPHLAHAAFGVFALLEFSLLRREELDDRYKQPGHKTVGG
jgi:hypothetical protein